MPLYEYRCEGCGQEFEVLVRATGERVRCPRCGAERVHKLISVPARARSASRTRLPIASRDGAPCGPGCCRLTGDPCCD